MNRQVLFYKKNAKAAQTHVEYVILIGFVLLVLVTMAIGIKRLVQGFVKTTADQIGVQQNADQAAFRSDEQDNSRGPKKGYLQEARTTMGTDKTDRIIEGPNFSLGVTRYEYDEEVTTNSASRASMGLSEDPQF